MKFYINNHTDPFFNLAAEEYFMSNAKEDIILLWRNDKTVVIGKNQNAFSEINFDFTNEHNIKVVRRLTGGGAVFHDLGNLNYTFISVPDGKFSNKKNGIDFAHFCKPIINALCALGINARLSGRNDIVVDTNEGERKISGNAECVKDSKTLHHGTLLFSADLSKLSGALNPSRKKLESRGISSVKSRVANLSELLSPKTLESIPDVTAFSNYIAKYLSLEFGISPCILDENQEKEISALSIEKYSLDSWNLHRFGSFLQSSSAKFNFGEITVMFTVKEGYIQKLDISGDFFGTKDISLLTEKLIGVEYSREKISKSLKELKISDYIYGADCNLLVDTILMN